MIRDYSPRVSTAAKRKPAVPAPSAIPFPFVGAGDASYFEWAEVHVWFTRAPKPAERKKILLARVHGVRSLLRRRGPSPFERTVVTTL